MTERYQRALLRTSAAGHTLATLVLHGHPQDVLDEYARKVEDAHAELGAAVHEAIGEPA